MSSPLRLCGALALLLLSLATGCRKEAATQEIPTPAAAVPPPAVSAPPVPDAVIAEPPPSLEDALACEALMGLRTLMDGQTSVFAEKSSYTADPSLLPALPACADGTRTPTPDGTWSSGCHFRYRITATTPLPTPSFTLQAVGAGAAEGREYAMSSGLEDSQRVWPAALDPEVCGSALAPSVCEAAQNLRALFTAEKAYFGERDRYSQDLATVGFVPEPCLDGTRADGLPPPGAGCYFHYHVEVQGTAPQQTFTATARGTGPLEGTTLQYRSDSTWSPEGVSLDHCFETGEPTACEAAVHLRSLFTAEKAHFAERDSYSTDLALIGFEAPPCIDGSRAGGGLPPAAGCHYVYRVEVEGTAPEQTFTAIARGVGEVEGTELRLSSSFAWSPAEPACGG